jgi:3-phenylpropionate/trans-cinnamate dioxygenase ferredoxin reductase component
VADREVDFLLIGGGLASASCAAELRKRGAEGSVLLAGREPEPPYERPPLSKEYLRGEAERADAYVNPPSWYEENGVELLSGTNVMSLDPGARTAKLQGGEEVGFGKALIATGAMVNILRVEGAENEGIHYLRAYGNSDAIRADAEAAEHVVLIGGSHIGADRERHQVHDRDDGGRGAFAQLRRGRGPLVPPAARVQGRDHPRRRGARGL